MKAAKCVHKGFEPCDRSKVKKISGHKKPSKFSLFIDKVKRYCKYGKRFIRNAYLLVFYKKHIAAYDKYTKEYILDSDAFMLEVLEEDKKNDVVYAGEYKGLIREVIR